MREFTKQAKVFVWILILRVEREIRAFRQSIGQKKPKRLIEIISDLILITEIDTQIRIDASDPFDPVSVHERTHVGYVEHECSH